METPSSYERFEYRVFARALRALRDGLGKDMRTQETDSRCDVYLLGRRDDRSVKIRAGAFDIKSLRETNARLERWGVLCNRSLPVEGAWVREQLAEHLGVGSLEAPRDRYSGDALIGQIVDPHESLTATIVQKERTRFSRDCIAAEWVRVRTTDRTDETVAVEGTEAGTVRGWVTRLGLDRWSNTSYLRWLLDRPGPNRTARSPRSATFISANPR